ncbi:MAG TPA: phosphoribosylformimino-5-aminoimidazole carboxamide ribotide isomerase [Lachnospiraceae bacterium]|nr:phosphoribosylformimino-5-aminoimidazole carboxamide ribotide isomerase [Lachnospiraceae bacterium]
MEFRPCIDIHNGQVKQIVGGSLQDDGDRAKENYVSSRDAACFAEIYRDAGIRGGHVILLNPEGSSYYDATKEQALKALRAYPGGLQAGGGIHPENAADFLEAGASHVIVTSYVFCDGRIHYDRLKKMADAVGKERLVLDLSCRRTQSGYRIVTDRWQKLTEEEVGEKLMERLSAWCDEFLVHAVDVEGKAGGMDEELIALLGRWEGKPVTYAGGVHSYEDLETLHRLGRNRVNVTVGSALDLFGGSLSWKKAAEICAAYGE